MVPADGSPWRWKDPDDPEAMAAAGRITTAEAGQIHADAEAVAALLDTDDRWWQPWDTWVPGDPVPPRPGRQEQSVTTIRPALGRAEGVVNPGEGVVGKVAGVERVEDVHPGRVEQ